MIRIDLHDARGWCVATPDRTEFGSAAMTPTYAAPEQIERLAQSLVHVEGTGASARRGGIAHFLAFTK